MLHPWCAGDFKAAGLSCCWKITFKKAVRYLQSFKFLDLQALSFCESTCLASDNHKGLWHAQKLLL